MDSETLEEGTLSKIIDLDGAAAHYQLNGGHPKQRFYLIGIDPQGFAKKNVGLGPLHQVVMPGRQNRGIIAHGYNGENLKELIEPFCSVKFYTQANYRVTYRYLLSIYF